MLDRAGLGRNGWGSRALAGAVIAGLAAACGADPATSGTTSTSSGSGSGGGPPELAIVHGAPMAPAKEPDRATYAIDGYASAMAVNGGVLAAGTTTRVYGLGAMDPKLLPITGDEPDLPPATGAVRAMAPYGDGILIAADAALFYTAGSALQLSLANEALFPLGIVGMSARVADDDGDGTPETHLLLRAADAAYEVDFDTLTKWTVDGETGAPSAALGTKERLFLAWGRRVYELDKAEKKAYPLGLDVGRVGAMACGTLACDAGSPIYFGSDAGLVERSATGAYTLYPLVAEGAPGLTVDAFALDAGKQRLYALAGTLVLRVRVGAPPDAAATVSAPVKARALAVDKVGDVWLGEGQTLARIALGTPLSFATDVKPVVHAYCSECHASGANGAPVIDFESYDTMKKRITTVLMRVTEGTMPPLSYAKKLPKETVQLFTEWSATQAP